MKPAKKSILTPSTTDSTKFGTELTPRQAEFVEMRAMGATTADASRAVFGHRSTGQNIMHVPKITQALINERARNAVMLGLTRDKVLQGFLDAIDQAKAMADPMSQIAAWREIAKVCGFNAPEVKKIELTGGAQRVIDRMTQLSDKELFDIFSAEDIVDVESREVQE